MPLVVCRVDLSGRWEKVKENSDLPAYEKMLSLLGLTGIKRTAALKLINGLVIEQVSTPPQFTVRYVVSRVQFLQSIEQFELGQLTEMPRRDGQPGSQKASLTELSSGMQTVITWGETNPGWNSVYDDSTGRWTRRVRHVLESEASCGTCSGSD